MSSLTALLIATCTLSPAQTPELIERTLAIVAGQPITLLDVRGALALGLIEKSGGPDQVSDATARLIERALVLREVQRYTTPDPPDAALDERLRALASPFGSTDAYRAALAAAGLSEAEVRLWVRDDLRIAGYLDQRFATAGSPERRAELVRDWIADIRRRTPVVELKQ